jgi:integrase
VVKLAWSDVDRARGLVTLHREHSKNAEPRIVPLSPGLAEIIERRGQARTIAPPGGGTALAEFVFYRAGQPVGSFRKAWAKACTAAGVPGLLFHDLRRSAVRNFERAGTSQAVAVKITGHKTATQWNDKHRGGLRDGRPIGPSVLTSWLTAPRNPSGRTAAGSRRTRRWP